MYPLRQDFINKGRLTFFDHDLLYILICQKQSIEGFQITVVKMLTGVYSFPLPKMNNVLWPIMVYQNSTESTNCEQKFTFTQSTATDCKPDLA